jgi:hypothetical protein
MLSKPGCLFGLVPMLTATDRLEAGSPHWSYAFVDQAVTR